MGVNLWKDVKTKEGHRMDKSREPSEFSASGLEARKRTDYARNFNLHHHHYIQEYIFVAGMGMYGPETFFVCDRPIDP